MSQKQNEHAHGHGPENGHEHGHGQGHEHDHGDRPAAGLSRRDFLRVSGTLSASIALLAAGCQNPAEPIVPFHERPEGLRTVGKPRFYATVLDGAPLLVRTREGRPILVAPNPSHPSGVGLTVRHHAALLDLYDADRAQGPRFVGRGVGATTPASWQSVGAEVVRALKAGKGALLVRPLRGAGERALVEDFARATGARVVEWAPLQADGLAAGTAKALGAAAGARPRLDRAELVVGFGAEFVDLPVDGLETAFAARRDPLAAAGMSRFVQFEGRLSLTGANADRRVRVRDSQLATVALGVAHALVSESKIGPLAGQARVVDALQPFAPEAVAGATGVPADVLRATAGELAAGRGKAVVLTGPTACSGSSGEALAAAVALLNHSVGAYEATHDPQGPEPDAGGVSALAGLARALAAGEVTTLLVAGCNPVYDAPAALGFAAALAKAELVVSLNDRVDETTALADWLAPASHPFETWGDAAYASGVHSIAQPVIRPLYDTWGLLDVLATWGAAVKGHGPLAAAVARATPPAAAGAAPADAHPVNLSAGYHYLRAWWGRSLLDAEPGTPNFEDAWEEALRAGFFRGQEGGFTGAAFDLAALELFAAAAPAKKDGLEVTFFPHFAHHDGRSGNNGWLHELPDPVTRITWGSWAAIAPRRFDELQLANGDLVALTVAGTTLTLPAYRAAGLHLEEVAVPLGLGRTAAGKVGDGTGVNAFPALPVEGGRALRSGLPATLARAGGREELAQTQTTDVLDRERRPVLPAAPLSAVRANPRAGTEQTPGGRSAWAGHEYKTNRWQMAIDLSRCNGCGKCVLACQAENNVPVVGREGVTRGRVMHWMRIDRYFDAPAREGGWDDAVWDAPLEVVEEPTTLFQPMLCQHCDNAPCETVCPFVATMHSEDGLNQQIYNRCVGTRYCANNCPFKVRRFNFWEYSQPQTNRFFRLLMPQLERHAELNARGRLPLKNNPEVTVRARGVMEKCSFCVQRIREARAEATRAGRKPHELPDGAVVPACMEACPTGAIVFGDAHDPASRVHALAQGPRAMRLLELINVKPSIAYLTRVRNDGAKGPETAGPQTDRKDEARHEHG
jgi:molybdopterin-containing oxidoreductase family iron-sulfur binding subunit